jgi:outer membrane protein assembly factor BamD (BamD/ComL family)
MPLAWCALAALGSFAGCASLWEKRSDDAFASGSTRSISGVRPASAEESVESPDGLTWSDFSFDNLGKTAKRLTGKGPNKEQARNLYLEAHDLFSQAMTADPKRRAEIYRMAAPKYAAAADRWPDSQLAMDSLFMAGEAYFFADDYPKANLHYEKLIKAFPNNRYLDAVDKRRFAIAKYWLDLNHDHAEPFYYVNWVNRSRPWRDARGHGLRIYDKIRVDDPTGKLADDATLAAGNEHFASGKFYKADDYYTDLRTAYPSSEHQFLAHFLGIKAKLSSYLGPQYSGTALDDTEKLIKQTRRQFPQQAEREREFLDKALAEVRYNKADQLMYLARYYDRRAEYRAAQHYYARINREFQDTPHAQQSQERIGQIAGLPPKPQQQLPWLVAMFPESDKVKPLLKATQQAQQQTQLAQQAEQQSGAVSPASYQDRYDRDAARQEAEEAEKLANDQRFVPEANRQIEESQAARKGIPVISSIWDYFTR